jgi:hypothetical protein
LKSEEDIYLLGGKSYMEKESKESGISEFDSETFKEILPNLLLESENPLLEETEFLTSSGE